jgi:hypothetical protein
MLLGFLRGLPGTVRAGTMGMSAERRLKSTDAMPCGCHTPCVRFHAPGLRARPACYSVCHSRDIGERAPLDI